MQKPEYTLGGVPYFPLMVRDKSSGTERYETLMNEADLVSYIAEKCGEDVANYAHLRFEETDLRKRFADIQRNILKMSDIAEDLSNEIDSIAEKLEDISL